MSTATLITDLDKDVPYIKTNEHIQHRPELHVGREYSANKALIYIDDYVE